MVKYVLIYSLGIIATISSTYLGYRVFGKLNIKKYEQPNKWPIILVIGLSLLYFMVFSVMKDLTVLSHHSYVDFAAFLEMFNNFSKGKGLFCSMQEQFIQGTGNWLSVHLTPLAFLFAYLFKVFPTFHTITWGQTLLLVLSPLFLYLFARKMVGSFSAACIALALLFNPTFQYITLYEFEYLRFIIPVGILALGITLGNYSILYIFLSSLAVLFIREDAVFLIVGLGLFLFIFQKDRRGLGVALAGLAVVYLVCVLQIVMPLFRGAGSNDHVAAPLFHEFGKTLPESLKNILLNPAKFFAYMLHPFKLFNWVMYILPFSFMPIAGADVLVITLPTLALLSFSISVTHTSYFLYYVAPILVVMVWSTIMGIPRLVKFAENKERLKKWLRHCPPSVERISFAVLIGSVACSIYFGPSPISIQFWFRDFSLAPFRTNTFYVERYKPTSHDEIVRKVAAMVPGNASISAEQFLLVDIYRSREIRVFPWIEDVDYVFIDKSNPLKTGIGVAGSWDGLRKNPQFYYDWVEKRPDVFELVYNEDGVFLFKRRANAPSYPQPHGAPL